MRAGVRRGSRIGAGLSALLLVISALSVNAITAGITVPEGANRPAIGPPSHAFGPDGVGRGPIPRAAFGELPARGPAAFGGDRIYDIDVDGTSYRVHEFTTVGNSTLTVTRPLDVEYLVVGGGGGGGGRIGGGGGAGGLALGSTRLTPANIEVAVGDGGETGATGLGAVGGNGEDSRLGDVVEVRGGGGGGGTDTGGDAAGQDGGSGGGGGRWGGNPGGLVLVAGQGSIGGAGTSAGVNDPVDRSGGGGGAGGSGASGVTSGDGGVGITSAITGTTMAYAGGGGGGAFGVAAAGRGGTGGGGAGGAADAGSPGADGTGGGGGGGGFVSEPGLPGGRGGSGIVIVRYEIPRTVWAPIAATGGSITEYLADGTNGTAGVRYRVHTFAASGTFDVTDAGSTGEVDVLLVGGGGGGGTRHGGGGGGGGVLEAFGVGAETGAHQIVVGLGGAGGLGASQVAPQSGGVSTALDLTALGGGRGGSGAGIGGPVGAPAAASGGGSQSGGSGPAGVAEQGNAGGQGVSGTSSGWGDWGGGGGGGAGGPGFPATGGASLLTARGGDGGPGRTSRMMGSEIVYGGGGGGSHELSRGNVLPPDSLGAAGGGGAGGGGAGGSLSWTLFSVPTNQGFPAGETDFDNLINASTFEAMGLTDVKSADSSSSREVDILDWMNKEDFKIPTVQDVIDDFAVIVTGTFVPSESGTYRFTIAGDDAVELFIGSTNVTNHYGGHGIAALGVHTGTIELEAGRAYPIRVRHQERGGGEGLRLFWRKPSQATETAWFRDASELRSTGRDGIDGLGGGGGAGGSTNNANANGGRGGDGIVVVRYPLDRLVTDLPSGVRDAIGGEGATSAVLRWRVPAIAPPSVDLDGYRLEYATASESFGDPLTSGVTFSTSGSDDETVVTAQITGIPPGARHRFRITPLGSVDGPSTIVTPVAKGGDTVTLVGDDVVHSYTAVGDADFVLRADRTVEYLVVGGGGSGGMHTTTNRGSGGGGAGGLLSGTKALSGGDLTVSVGAGGSAPTTDGVVGADGQASSALGFTASGGGGGGSAGVPPVARSGRQGGSGGGAGNHDGSPGGNIEGQGNDGGQESGDFGFGGAGGGGGGAGAVGGAASGVGDAANGGAGGDGTPSSITGTAVHYAGGGGGGHGGDAIGGDGGQGGGGVGERGSRSNPEAATSGSPGTGGGGGGARHEPPGSGGSGIVVLRYSTLDSGAQGAVFAEASTSAVLRWEEPAVGAGTITGYRIERSTDGATWTTVVATPTAVGTVRSVELAGLPVASARRFRVTALHGARDGSAPELAVVARGGDTVTLVAGDVVHAFTTTGDSTFTLTDARSLRYLVVGGGGSGGMRFTNNRGSGGGGAGGMRSGTQAVAAAEHVVVVGNGGIAQTSSFRPGNDGQNSSVFGVIVEGGGGGGGAGDDANSNRTGRSGGSGGGGANNGGRGGQGTVGEGFAGGDRSGNRASGGAGGGGGGAGGAGENAPDDNNGGAGGRGRTSFIDGFQSYAGGGGGGPRSDLGVGGQGGTGGGGDGERGPADNFVPAEAGVDGRGGGGGGARYGTPGAGGSGIVVIRYPLAAP